MYKMQGVWNKVQNDVASHSPVQYLSNVHYMVPGIFHAACIRPDLETKKQWNIYNNTT